MTLSRYPLPYMLVARRRYRPASRSAERWLRHGLIRAHLGAGVDQRYLVTSAGSYEVRAREDSESFAAKLQLDVCVFFIQSR